MNYAADSQTCLARLLSQSDLSGLNTQDKAVSRYINDIIKDKIFQTLLF